MSSDRAARLLIYACYLTSFYCVYKMVISIIDAAWLQLAIYYGIGLVLVLMAGWLNNTRKWEEEP